MTENAPLLLMSATSPDGVSGSALQLKAPMTPDQGQATLELWSSKELELLWLDKDHWTNPSFHDQIPAQGTTDGRGVGAAWYWPVNLEFGGWCLRTLRKAKQEDATVITPGVQAAFLQVQSYLKTRHPGCWPEVERLATVGPRLLLPAIPQTCIELARFGLLPRWRGWEKHAETSATVTGESESDGETSAGSGKPTLLTSTRRPVRVVTAKPPDRPTLF